MHTLEQVADSFVKDLQKRGFEPVMVTCVGDKRQSQTPTRDDVHTFLKTLNQDEAIQFDVDDTEVSDELVHGAPKEPEVDIDLDGQERLILARKVKYHWQYVAGLSRTGRVLFTTDARLARIFESEDSVIMTIFQFQGADEDMLVLKDIFKDLHLQMLPAPKEAL
jgi:hypothetical protein